MAILCYRATILPRRPSTCVKLRFVRGLSGDSQPPQTCPPPATPPSLDYTSQSRDRRPPPPPCRHSSDAAALGAARRRRRPGTTTQAGSVCHLDHLPGCREGVRSPLSRTSRRDNLSASVQPRTSPKSMRHRRHTPSNARQHADDSPSSRSWTGFIRVEREAREFFVWRAAGLLFSPRTTSGAGG